MDKSCCPSMIASSLRDGQAPLLLLLRASTVQHSEDDMCGLVPVTGREVGLYLAMVAKIDCHIASVQPSQ